MVARYALAAALSFVAGAAAMLGFVVRWDDSVDNQVAESAMPAKPLSESRRAPQQPVIDDVDLLQALHEAQVEIAILRKLLADAEIESQGTTIPWDDQVDPTYTPNGFKATMDLVLDECGNGSLELVATDCNEPPCIAVLRDKGDDPLAYSRLFSSCPAWVERYGSGGSSHAAAVDCGGARQSVYTIAVPASRVLHTPEDDVDARNRIVRMQHRSVAAAERFGCASN